ncbi:MAG: electron transport complex subunit RsxC [Brevinematales bacterium]
MDKKQKIFTFKRGGVHPHEQKLTRDKTIVNADVPPFVRIPMTQHLGAPARVLVSVGDEVVEGQRIGEATGMISAHIHASVSGVVTAIEKANTLMAKQVDFVVIKTGGSFHNWVGEKFPWENLQSNQIVSLVQEAGVVGLGGATFPTHVKLSPPPGKVVETLILNGAECEPYLTIDHRMLLEKSQEILTAIEIVKRALPTIKKVYIGIEINKEDAIDHWTNLLAGRSDIKVAPLRTRYPQGGEKQLIQAITGKEVPTKGLPADIGVLVENVSTMNAIYEAVVYHKPLIERGLTYTGIGVPQPGNYKVRIGTPISHLIESYGKPEKFAAMISGGPMMGLEIFDVNMPVMKSTSGIVFLSPREDYVVEDRPCIRCAKCLAVCPIGLMPTEIARLADNFLVEEAASIGLFDCIECGACAYICPSKIPLVGLIRYGKEFYKRKQAQAKK